MFRTSQTVHPTTPRRRRRRRRLIRVPAILVALLASATTGVRRVRSLGSGGDTASRFGERTLGTLSVSPIAFGTLNLPVEEGVAAEIFSSLPPKTLIDTAELYGEGKNGKTETLTAEAARSADRPLGGGSADDDGDGATTDLFVATKFAPKPWRLDSRSVVSACRASLNRLGVPRVDLYQIHFADRSGFGGPKDESYWDGIAECYHSGLATNVGVCNYGPTMVRRSFEALSARDVPLVSNQINFNLMRFRSSLETKEACDELGVTVLGYHPLGGGVLADKYGEEYFESFAGKDQFAPGKAKSRRVRWYQKNCVPLLNAVRGIASSRRVTCSQVAVNWMLCKGVVPIGGARSMEQANDIAGALSFALTADEVEELDAASDASAEYTKGFDLT